MIPFANQTITLYHKQDDVYTRFVLNGVSWRQKVERTSNNNGRFDITSSTVVIIPATLANATNISLREGDVFVFGVGPNITKNFKISALKSENPTYCTIKSVSDNTTSPFLKHFKVVAV